MHGGLKLEPHKAESTREPILRGPRPSELVLPLAQHMGAAAKARVAVGDHVARGQPLADADGYLSAPVHAPASGTVVAIEPRRIAHPSGLATPCIVLETDAADHDWDGLHAHPQWRDLTPEQVRTLVRDAGIVGLGGAAFPTHVKLNPALTVDTLVLNGAECEPYISCDDRLMRERAAQVVAGAEILLHALQAKRCVIAIEEDKPEAIAAIKTGIAAQRRRSNTSDFDLALEVVPAIYPQGGERQLIATVTGRRVPSGGLPLNVGVVCHNVATAAAVAAAVLDGEPLTRRVVTMTGDAMAAPRNVDALYGTPVSALIAACGGYDAPVDRLVMGGPMMGFALPGDDVPVVKAMNCILAESDAIAAQRRRSVKQVQPCIRCTACEDACPAELLPQQLHWFARARDFDQARDHALFDCIECGVCDAVCPSDIPLAAQFRWAKAEIRARDDERSRAELAKHRFEARAQRLADEKREREERLKKKQDPAAIEAALARVKASR
ncbi:MAG: electron transport complex subunit RsxC [Gammaproteobacteria bacterium]